jgi:hypothetical protein
MNVDIFYRVARPLPAWHMVGYMEGNEWIGSSRCLWPIYRPVTLQLGDEVHELVGGTFAVLANGEVLACLVVLERPYARSVMLHGGIVDRRTIAERAPGYVAIIPPEGARRVGSYTAEFRTVTSADGFAITERAGSDPSTVARILLPGFEGRFAPAAKARGAS